jgi:monoamine oxidase
MGSLPDSVKAKLISQINADPGLPVESPTVSAWQIPPHALSEIRSQSLQQVVDFAIIGSGITGCSTAKTLLEHSGQSVTVFEARTLCSGATGRNGGHLVTSMPKEFKGVVARDGIDAAIQLARYSNRTVAKVAELAFSEQTNSGLSSEIRNVKEIMAFADLRSFVEALTSIQMYEDFVTEEKASHNVILAERAKAVRSKPADKLLLSAFKLTSRSCSTLMSAWR